MQKIRYSATMNGWKNDIVIFSQSKNKYGRSLQVKFQITGVTEEIDGIIDLEKGTLYNPGNAISIKPYNDEGKPKVFDTFKIPKYQLSQIRSYVDYIPEIKILQSEKLPNENIYTVEVIVRTVMTVNILATSKQEAIKILKEGNLSHDKIKESNVEHFDVIDSFNENSITKKS